MIQKSGYQADSVVCDFSGRFGNSHQKWQRKTIKTELSLLSQNTNRCDWSVKIRTLVVQQLDNIIPDWEILLSSDQRTCLKIAGGFWIPDCCDYGKDTDIRSDVQTKSQQLSTSTGDTKRCFSTLHQPPNNTCGNVPLKAILMEFPVHLYKYKDLLVKCW